MSVRSVTVYNHLVTSVLLFNHVHNLPGMAKNLNSHICVHIHIHIGDILFFVYNSDQDIRK